MPKKPTYEKMEERIQILEQGEFGSTTAGERKNYRSIIERKDEASEIPRFSHRFLHSLGLGGNTRMVKFFSIDF